MTEYTGKENLNFLEKIPNYVGVIGGFIREFIGSSTKVLDFGAGSGIYPRFLRVRGITPDCVEIDPAYVAELNLQGFRCFQGLGEAPGKYERIYSCDVIEHIEDDVAALRNLHDKLEVGGKILLYVPAFNVLYSEMDKHIGHFRRYTRGVLVERMKQAGFIVESSQYVDFIGFFGALYYKHFVKYDGSIDSPSVYFYYRYIFPISRVIDRLGGKFMLGKNLMVTARRS